MASGRRGNREGSIVKRADGRWMARVSLPNGKRRSFYGKTRQEASQKMHSALRDVERGMPLADERLTVSQFLDQWLETNVKPNVRPATYESYEGHVRNHIKPALGRARLSRLTPQRVEAMFAALLDKGLSASTVQRVRATLRRALNLAMKYELVGRNVASLADAPKAARPKFEPLTPEQAKQFLAAVRGDRLEGLYNLVLATGLRQGEALGLQWADVDLEAGTLHVRYTLRCRNGERVLVAPKTDASVRTVSLAPFAVTKLREHRARQNRERLLAGNRWQASDFVFTTHVGRPMLGPDVTKRFQEILSREGLPRKRFHDLRHSAATYMLAQGVSMKVVSTMLGHSTIALTADTYSHVLPALQEDAADRMDKLLSGE